MFHLPTTTCPVLHILHVFVQCMYYVSSFRRVHVLHVHLLTIHERLLLVIVVFPTSDPPVSIHALSKILIVVMPPFK